MEATSTPIPEVIGVDYGVGRPLLSDWSLGLEQTARNVLGASGVRFGLTVQPALVHISGQDIISKPGSNLEGLDSIEADGLLEAKIDELEQSGYRRSPLREDIGLGMVRYRITTNPRLGVTLRLNVYDKGTSPGPWMIEREKATLREELGFSHEITRKPDNDPTYWINVGTFTGREGLKLNPKALQAALAKALPRGPQFGPVGVVHY